MPSTSPVILIPGITATYLRDQYPIPPEIVWAVIKKDFGRAALHPNNLKFEASQPARVLPDQLYEIAYAEIIEELRYNLSASPEDQVPVYPFGYDWRQPLDVIERQLAEFVDEVIERTKLMRNYHSSGYAGSPKVSLIGHSMGGLVVAGYLQSSGAEKVDKVVSLASPFQGSFEAIIKITTGTANLGTKAPSSREREAARLTPALYHLLPSIDTGLSPAGGGPESLFDRDAWQPSIIASIREYVRQYGLEPGATPEERAAQAESVFESMLARAAEHRHRLDTLSLSDAGLDEERWLCVIGVDSVTRVKAPIEFTGDGPQFIFATSDRQNNWGDEDSVPDERRLTGDGTVSFNGAVPQFLPYETLVCVTPDDYGYWELQDRATTRLGGFHGILPNMNMLHRLIVRHLTGAPDNRGNTWGRPAPGVDAGSWRPPIDDLPDRMNK